MTAAGQTLVKELQRELKAVEADLRGRSEEADLPWAQDLRAEYAAAFARGRTGLSWSEWRDGEVAQAAVAWVLGTVFVRFCEDNRLLDGVWIAGPGDRLGQAVDAESAYYQADHERNVRDWLREAFAALAATKAGRGVLDPDHSPVWFAPLGADSCSALLRFWRERDASGALLRDFSDPAWDTRFLGDLYQDLSELAKKKYALLQTPVFVEEFILDRTLTPALAEFGLQGHDGTGFRMIDPTCGSGHFLLGAFERLLQAWQAAEPDTDRRVLVQRALDSVHGVDMNPFAVAVARFRLTVAALRASGLTRLAEAPAFAYHVAVGDSLLAGFAGRQGTFDDEEGAASFAYAAEDIAEHPGILDRGRYHVVVGNPPYITVKDPALNEAYRASYSTCHRQYALSVPFMELFFELAVRGDRDRAAGFVGQITSNSFMKREFGKKVIEQLLSGKSPGNPVDLLDVIDTSGAYIPGHGTPTVILVGRRRRPVGDTVGAVLGIRGEPGAPEDASKGLVWCEIVDTIGQPGLDGRFVSVRDSARESFATHPWSLTGGGAEALKQTLEVNASRVLSSVVDEIGFGGVTREDSAYIVGQGTLRRRGFSPAQMLPLVEGEFLRDYVIDAGVEWGLWPYDEQSLEARSDERTTRFLWPLRVLLRSRVAYGKTQLARGLKWFEYSMFFTARFRRPLSIAFAFVATHNHFVLDRGGKVFNRSAPVIKLPAGTSEEDHLALLAVLNSSAACFWLKQVSHDKGIRGEGGGFTPSEWERFYEFTGTKLQEFPLPQALPHVAGRRLDELAQRLESQARATIAASTDSLGKVLLQGREAAAAIRAQMIAEQEELDWEVYGSYSLLPEGESLTYAGEAPALALGERAFEFVLARRMAAGTEESAWFERHGSTPITELPGHWPDDYRRLVERRIELIESDPFIGLLERPEYKRRWASRSWEELEREALSGLVLDRLEEPSLWSDGQGPRVLSVAQLADLVRRDERLVEALQLLTGSRDVDVTAALGKLVAEEAVPFLAAWRYTDDGLRKRAEWENVWALQREEDATGKTLQIPAPPKYTNKDFRKGSYWSARGKLDVPKERFVLYPDAGRAGDPTLVLGWAGWDHAEQARALARLVVERVQEGWDAAALTPLLAGLAELEPWLHQWHGEVDPAFGASPAELITGMLEGQLSGLGLTRADLAAWRPPTPTRGRPRRTGG